MANQMDNRLSQGHPLHGDGHYGGAFQPGVIVPIPSRPGAFRTDIHGDTQTYVNHPVSWLIAPGGRAPRAHHRGGGSQAIDTPQESIRQQAHAGELGQFASPTGPLANFDAIALPTGPPLPVEYFSVGHFQPGHPLGVTTSLGARHSAPARPVSPLGTDSRPGW